MNLAVCIPATCNVCFMFLLVRMDPLRSKLCNDALLGAAFPASRAQHMSDLHSKFALGPHHVSKYGRHPICGR